MPKTPKTRKPVDPNDPLAGLSEEERAYVLRAEGSPDKAVTAGDEKVQSLKAIEIPLLDIRKATFLIDGDTPLIVHKWAEKVIKELLDKHMGKGGEDARPPKNPDDEYYESIYHLDGQGNLTASDTKTTGFPTQAFKLASVGACRFIKGLTMVAAAGVFHAATEFTIIKGEHRIRRDMVRVGGKGPGTGAPVVRFRAEYPVWSAAVTFEYNAGYISDNQIARLLNTAGFHVGIGEWRPEKHGRFGRFHVKGM